MTAQAMLACVEPPPTRVLSLRQNGEVARAMVALIRGELTRVQFEIVLREVGR